MIKQTKKMLGIFKNGDLEFVIESPGATTFYSTDIYTHAESDRVENLLRHRRKPSAVKLRKIFADRDEKELEDIGRKLKIDMRRVDKVVDKLP